MTHTHDDELHLEFIQEQRTLINTYINQGLCLFHQIILGMNTESILLLAKQMAQLKLPNDEKKKSYDRSIDIMVEQLQNSKYFFSEVACRGDLNTVVAPVEPS